MELEKQVENFIYSFGKPFNEFHLIYTFGLNYDVALGYIEKYKTAGVIKELAGSPEKHPYYVRKKPAVITNKKELFVKDLKGKYEVKGICRPARRNKRGVK